MAEARQVNFKGRGVRAPEPRRDQRRDGTVELRKAKRADQLKTRRKMVPPPPKKERWLPLPELPAVEPAVAAAAAEVPWYDREAPPADRWIDPAALTAMQEAFKDHDFNDALVAVTTGWATALIREVYNPDRKQAARALHCLCNLSACEHSAGALLDLGLGPVLIDAALDVDATIASYGLFAVSNLLYDDPEVTNAVATSTGLVHKMALYGAVTTVWLRARDAEVLSECSLVVRAMLSPRAELPPAALAVFVESVVDGLLKLHLPAARSEAAQSAQRNIVSNALSGLEGYVHTHVKPAYGDAVATALRLAEPALQVFEEIEPWLEAAPHVVAEAVRVVWGAVDTGDRTVIPFARPPALAIDDVGAARIDAEGGGVLSEYVLIARNGLGALYETLARAADWRLFDNELVMATLALVSELASSSSVAGNLLLNAGVFEFAGQVYLSDRRIRGVNFNCALLLLSFAGEGTNPELIRMLVARCGLVDVLTREINRAGAAGGYFELFRPSCRAMINVHAHAPDAFEAAIDGSAWVDVIAERALCDGAPDEVRELHECVMKVEEKLWEGELPA